MQVPHVATRVHYWPWKQVNDEFDFDRLAEVFGGVYRAYASDHNGGGGALGPYGYIVLNHDFWTSTDFLARFRGNFFKAVRCHGCSFCVQMRL